MKNKKIELKLKAKFIFVILDDYEKAKNNIQKFFSWTTGTISFKNDLQSKIVRSIADIVEYDDENLSIFIWVPCISTYLFQIDIVIISLIDDIVSELKCNFIEDKKELLKLNKSPVSIFEIEYIKFEADFRINIKPNIQ